MDTPVGRATEASQWRYPYPPDPTDKQRVAVVVSRLAFKAGAAWSRTDALHDPTDTEIEAAARAAWDTATRESYPTFESMARSPRRDWDEADADERAEYRDQARAVLSSFLTGRRAEG